MIRGDSDDSDLEYGDHGTLKPAASDSSSPDTDKDFDPSAEMLVHDFDDEKTLEEEEALSGDSCSNELDDLEKEGEMPIEELLAMYRDGNNPQDTRSSSEEEILSNQDLTLDKEEIARDLLQNSDDMDDQETSVTDLLDSVEPSHTARLLRVRSKETNPDESSDDDSEDGDYQPLEDDWKKVIQVGSDYQAMVPDGLSRYGDAPAYENEDRLLWDPSKMENSMVEKYLGEFHAHNMQQAGGVNAIPQGTHVRDDEQALYMLLQCGHNVEEAIRRRKMQAVPPTDPMSLWSEEECRNFENGLRTYGKDFYLIQQNKVRTRSVGELVQFYYLWKKTERHDAFASKTRLEKRKYVLHPGVTDYMDRFLDDLGSPTPVRDRSTSPSLNSLIYTDQKFHHHHQLKPVSVEADSSSFSSAAHAKGTSVEASSEQGAGTATSATTTTSTLTHSTPTVATSAQQVLTAASTVSSSSDCRVKGEGDRKRDSPAFCLSATVRDKAADDADDEDEGEEDSVVKEPVVKKLKKDFDTVRDTNCEKSISNSNHIEGVIPVTTVRAVHSIDDSVNMNAMATEPVHMSHQQSESVAQ
ncbi:mesoderm induction early response protein 1-like [Liolophura sinensis]|uniref:mesoderm induction early response protein 1-like n=1 Tax=Liolophura sinensis TaxID=3198878 RepID=UPI00315891FA